jgi:hypothetical protein
MYFAPTPVQLACCTERLDVPDQSSGGWIFPPAVVREWLGDSRGHWEGNSLVVDTTNYRPRAFQNVSSEKLHITERFTRQDAETIRYEITVNDPDTWTKPWSLMILLQRSAQPVYEYACHEGNVGLAGILAGARADEANASSK